MIELIFRDSSAGCLSYAKSMKHGQEIKDTSMLRRSGYTIPTHWPGLSMDGSPEDVAPLWLSLDIGALDNAETREGTRLSVLKTARRGRGNCGNEPQNPGPSGKSQENP